MSLDADLPPAQQPAPAAATHGSALVGDINDRSPFDCPWEELTSDAVARFLATTSDDEPLSWEAKGSQIRTDHVARAVAGLANREGGYLVLGASRDDNGAWHLDGVEFPQPEPRTWISSVIRDNLSPPPQYDVNAWPLSNGKKAAVVQVQPNVGTLSLYQGRIYYRRPGETSFIENGAELQTVQATVQFRSRALPGVAVSTMTTGGPPVTVDLAAADLTAGLEPAEFLALVQQLARRGERSPIGVFLAGATTRILTVIREADESALAAMLDRVVDCAATLLTYTPTSEVTKQAIGVLHKTFDAGLEARGPVVGSAPVFAYVLSRARALGALAIRLEQWHLARALIVHDVALESPRDRLWFRYGDVDVSRANLYQVRGNPLETSRAPIRRAAEHVLRLPSLRPEGLTDEDAVITSVCQFDFATHMVSTCETLPAQPDYESFPYYAAWDGERVRPLASTLVGDQACRQGLLGEIADAELATLLRFVASEAARATQGMGSWLFWDGFDDGRIARFLAQHPPPAA